MQALFCLIMNLLIMQTTTFTLKSGKAASSSSWLLYLSFFLGYEESIGKLWLVLGYLASGT